MSILLFTTPRPFVFPFDYIQRNAFQSWSKFMPTKQVEVYADAQYEGQDAMDEARLNGFITVGMNYECRSQRGVPLVKNLFETSLMLARTTLMASPDAADAVCYTNSDLILQRDLPDAIAVVRKKFDTFLAISGRWNVQILGDLDFGEGWQDRLWKKTQEQGSRMPDCAIDIFAWRGEVFKNIDPRLAIGRYKWDMLLVGEALRNKVPVVNITPVVKVFHQAHQVVPWMEPDAAVNHSVDGPCGGVDSATHDLTGPSPDDIHKRQ